MILVPRPSHPGKTLLTGAKVQHFGYNILNGRALYLTARSGVFAGPASIYDPKTPGKQP
jgi:hypothetical protein